jgi:hypothetical protein
VTVEVLELGTEGGSVIETPVAVYAEKDLLGTSRVEIVLHHEIQELPVAISHLIYKLREGDAARDQTLAGFARVELPETAIGVPDDDPWGDVPDPHCLLHHDGPFLARCGSFPTFPTTPDAADSPFGGGL